jgi:hypothetical protein
MRLPLILVQIRNLEVIKLICPILDIQNVRATRIWYNPLFVTQSSGVMRSSFASWASWEAKIKLFSGANAQTEGLGAGIAVIARSSCPVIKWVSHKNRRTTDGRTNDIMCEMIHVLESSLSA